MKRTEDPQTKKPDKDGKPRIQRFYGTTLYKVRTLAPWAKKIAKVDGIYIAYESEEEYAERHGISDLSTIRSVEPNVQKLRRPPRTGVKRVTRRSQTLSPSMIEGIAKYVEYKESRQDG